jgi:hypothetical protein
MRKLKLVYALQAWYREVCLILTTLRSCFRLVFYELGSEASATNIQTVSNSPLRLLFRLEGDKDRGTLSFSSLHLVRKLDWVASWFETRVIGLNFLPNRG